MNKTLKYSIGIIIAILIIYLSLDIQNLEKHKAAAEPAGFNATDFARKFWNDSIPLSINSATELSYLMQLLDENANNAFEKYGRKLGISKTYYFMAKGQGKIIKVEDEFLLITLDDQEEVKIAIDFIFGNAVRDGSGKVNINNFLNMTDFNAVSVALNKLVKEKVVFPLRKSASVGKKLEFVGAMELSEESIDLSEFILIPVSVNISDGQTE